tara:strand:- start:1050 stop:1343 length:294 start_codon:yes stop_codon:yes gene_type:complete
MRKVTTQIAQAFKAGKPKTIGNTMTDGQAVWLHGNKIAEKQGNGLRVTLAGWNTPTTRERVNGVLWELGYKDGYTQKNFEPYFNGELVCSSEWQDIN